MKTILLEELDPRTGEWLRETSRHDGVIVTEEGKPLLTISPAQTAPKSRKGRVLLPGFEALMNRPIDGTDSTEIISQDREDRL